MKEAIKIIPIVGKVVAAYINSKISNIVLNKIGWDIAKTLYMKKYGVKDKNVEAYNPCKSLLP
ncbi:MAG: hypothetical protein IKN12_09655 [Selenomonadaceae bacterium]|nr:hypothetical protein [Selenomonadaceae bacterium]